MTGTWLTTAGPLAPATVPVHPRPASTGLSPRSSEASSRAGSDEARTARSSPVTTTSLEPETLRALSATLRTRVRLPPRSR